MAVREERQPGPNRVRSQAGTTVSGYRWGCVEHQLFVFPAFEPRGRLGPIPAQVDSNIVCSGWVATGASPDIPAGQLHSGQVDCAVYRLTQLVYDFWFGSMAHRE